MGEGTPAPGCRPAPPRREAQSHSLESSHPQRTQSLVLPGTEPTHLLPL